MRPLLCVIPLLASLATTAGAQPESIVGSPHDLSVGGPGPVRATFEDQVCIFCHTPHNASPIRPLWNRYLPVDNYRIYASRALDAEPGQPTGASKMCLSCHDGTIALGVVFSRQTPILMAGGVTVMPDGAANLGTDLSDDHPISFRYDSALSARDEHLLDPALLPDELRLDANGELQCTTCHDAHDDSRGNFLAMHNFDSQLCNACHQISTTTIAEHESCNACHQPHTAPSGPYLLRGHNVVETCLACHDGGFHGAANIANDLGKPSIHETYSQVDPPDPQYMHTSCTSCHDPHSMHAGSAEPPLVHPNMGAIDGVNASGSPVTVASYEYEVCFKCHADQQAVQPFIQRLAPANNTRQQFSPGAISYHPVEAPGRSSDVPSLRPGWTTSSLVQCSDCHGSNSGSAGGGSGPDGVHGSMFSPLLVARYDTSDYTTESAGAYALCYQCHDRTSILGDESFPMHDKHIRDERTPCSACHTGHGIASGQGTTTANSHLINFDTAIVFPNGAGRLEFRDTGSRSGECFLSCHGENHDPESYPDD
jgi:predicted CXXCH cytochrome family protein